MIIPGTWSASAINRFTRDMGQPGLGAIITNMQMGGISIQGLSALSANQVNVISTMNSASISDGISIANAQSLTAHMHAAFNNRESEV